VSPKKKGLASTGIPLNFLLGCSERALGGFELQRLAEVADLRSELHRVLDRLIDQMAQAALAAWFRRTDTATLKRALENPEDILLWAKEQIRDGQRSEKELEELFPQASLPPGAAHLAAALRYQERNIAGGKCCVCPHPLDENSVRYCTKHLAAARGRHKPKDRKDEAPGSIGFLYQDHTPESRHNRAPSQIAAMEMGREQRTRKLLAELGIPPESAAVSLKAVKDALLKCMPDSKSRAMTQAQLFEAATVVTRTTGQKALNELISAGTIQRIGKGGPRDLYRYFEEREEANGKRGEK
jgi:hypothetical protein